MVPGSRYLHFWLNITYMLPRQHMKMVLLIYYGLSNYNYWNSHWQIIELIRRCLAWLASCSIVCSWTSSLLEDTPWESIQFNFFFSNMCLMLSINFSTTLILWPSSSRNDSSKKCIITCRYFTLYQLWMKPMFQLHFGNLLDFINKVI